MTTEIAVTEPTRVVGIGQRETPAEATARASGGRVDQQPEREHSTSPNGVATEQRVLDQIRSFTAVISPARAAEMLTDFNTFEGQRAVRPRHVAYLLSAMQAGELVDLALIFAELPDGSRMLVDGQHRLTALAQFTKPLPASIVVHRVNDRRQLATRYAMIDRQASRTPGEMLHAFGLDARTGLSRTTLSYVGAGVTIVASGFSRYAISHTRSLIKRTHDVEAWLPEGLIYARWLEGGSQEVTKLLWRAPVVAVALATIRYQPTVAETFWKSIVDEAPIPKFDARARLLAYLRSNRVAPIGQYLYCRHVAGAWNAYFTGRTLERLQIKDPSLPVRIMGTPYGRDGEA